MGCLGSRWLFAGVGSAVLRFCLRIHLPDFAGFVWRVFSKSPRHLLELKNILRSLRFRSERESMAALFRVLPRHFRHVARVKHESLGPLRCKCVRNLESITLKENVARSLRRLRVIFDTACHVFSSGAAARCPRCQLCKGHCRIAQPI